MNSPSISRFLVAATFALLCARAQSASPTFEVASIKPAEGDDGRVMFQMVPGGGLNAKNMSLKQLIAFAYNIPCGRNCDHFIEGGPSWIDSQRFDVLAKASADAPPPVDVMRITDEQRRQLQQQVRQRLQALLADRFQLTLHKTTKELPVYALVVGKSGHKLKESTAEANQQQIRMTRGELNAQGMTLEGLVNSLSGNLGRPVIDRTGLSGRYDFKLEWTPEFGGPGGPGPGGPGGAGPRPDAASGPELSGPTIFTAVQEQLGLKLESTKGPVETYVIDRAEKPSAN